MARLPMQWSLSGHVIWRAPRAFALAFTPVLAALIMGCTAILPLLVAVRSGQEDHVVPVLLLMAMLFFGIHVLHIRLIARASGRNDN